MDDILQTSVPGIHAAGDVLGENMFVYTAAFEGQLASRNALTGDQVKRYHPFSYQAGSWSEARRVVAKVEMSKKGVNIRFISTEMMQIQATVLYEMIYCARGNMEGYIKDHPQDPVDKTYLHSDRNSCHHFSQRDPCGRSEPISVVASFVGICSITCVKDSNSERY